MKRFRISVLVCIYLGGGALLAQPYSHTPIHEYESFYQKFRREKIKTKPEDYELKGPVREVAWRFDDSGTGSYYAIQKQRFTFSTDGLLTSYVLGDTAINQEESNYWFALSWHLYYNPAHELDTMRVAEFRGRTNDVYWYEYDSAGFLSSAGHYDSESPVAAINYVYTSYDSFLSVTTSPFEEYDITGNVIGDSVHFVFDSFGRVSSERVFYFWGEDDLTFTWSDAHTFRYSIIGRSYMEKTGTWKCNSAGRLLHATSSGYFINQQGTFPYETEDSLVYNNQGLLIVEYYLGEPLPPQLLFNLLANPSTSEPSGARLKTHRRYTYTFDKHGNWITRSHFDAGGKYVGKERREITYY